MVEEGGEPAPEQVLIEGMGYKGLGIDGRV